MLDELNHFRNKELEAREEIESLKKENEKAFLLLDEMKRSSEELINKNKYLASRSINDQEL